MLDVNQETLDLFQAPDKPTLLHRLGEVFRDDMERSFREQLIDLWNGKLFQQREVLNYAAQRQRGRMSSSSSRCCPATSTTGRWCRCCATDITACKKAETYLEFLGTHDVLTKLYNRAFYVRRAEPVRAEGAPPGDGHHWPTSMA